MYNDYYTRNNISSLNSNNYINFTNSFLQPTIGNQVTRNSKFQNNINERSRGISEDVENRRLNNNPYFNPNSSYANWQKLKDQILSPGDEENYYNNSQINYNFQTPNTLIPQYNSLYNNNIKNYRSSSSTRINKYNTINSNNTFLPIETIGGKKTLILDLDETLVHSAFKPFFIKSDINLSINVDGINHLVHVLKRPFVDEFLQRMSKFYELVIFTASISNYANPLLDRLDKFRLITHRLFREHCVSNNGLFIKDLRKLGRDLKNMIIIDNNPISYAVNQDNGIPILTWHYDKNDNELMKLIPILEFLSNVEDVRLYIIKFVKRNTNEVDFNVVNEILNENKRINLNNNNNTNSNISNNNNNININNINNANNANNVNNIGNIINNNNINNIGNIINVNNVNNVGNIINNNNNNIQNVSRNNLMENIKRFGDSVSSAFQTNNTNSTNIKNEKSIVIPPNNPSKILSEIHDHNQIKKNNVQNNNFRPYTASNNKNFNINNLSSMNNSNNNLNNNLNSNDNNKDINKNILTYKSQLAYTPKVNYRNVENKKNLNDNNILYNNKKTSNYASYTGMYLNRGHEQIKNDLDDISNNNNYSNKNNNSIDFNRSNSPNSNIINKNFNIENKGKTNQERSKESLFSKKNSGNDNNLKNNYSNKTIFKNYTQNSVTNLQSISNKINEINKTLFEYNNETNKYNLYNTKNPSNLNQTKINNYISNYQSKIRTSTPQIYRNNISLEEGINNFQAKYNVYNRNENNKSLNNLQFNNNTNQSNNLINNNNKINNNMYNRSSSLFYQRKNMNLENLNQIEKTEETKDFNLSQLSNSSNNNYVKTPQRNFERSILFTPNRRYDNIININNNHLTNSRSVERPKRVEINSTPFLQERENNLKFGNGNFVNYDNYMKNKRSYQYGNNNNEIFNQGKDRILKYGNLYGNNNIQNYNFYPLRNYGNNNDINNMNINFNNNINYINNNRSYLNNPLTNYSSSNYYTNNINNLGNNSNFSYQNIRDRRYYNF